MYIFINRIYIIRTKKSIPYRKHVNTWHRKVFKIHDVKMDINERRESLSFVRCYS